MKTILALLTLLTLHSQLPTLNAQWPTTPDSGLVVGYGDFPSIVSDDDGGAIVAFRANNPSQIKVKRVDKYGYQQWNGFSGVVAGGIADWQDYSDIAEDGRGGVLVSFQDIDCYTDCYLPWMTYSSYVTVNRIDHLGNKLWGEGVRVTVHDTIIQDNAQVKSDAHAGAIISWLQNGYLYVQRIDSMGNRMWSDTGMVVGASTSKPLMVSNAQGATFFRWSDRIQKVSIHGDKLWTPTGLLAGETPAKIGIGDDRGGVIIGGNYVSTWLFKLTCQRFDSLGNKYWGDGGALLVDSVDVDNLQASTLLLVEDTLLISYWHNKFGFTDFFVQKIDPLGNKLFEDVGQLISPYPSSKGGFMVLSDDSLLFVWNDGRAGAFCQKLDLLGNRLWMDDRYFYSEEYSYLTNDRKGGAILLSQDLDFSISLSKVSKNGNVGEVVTFLHSARPSNKPPGFILLQNYPNPFNPGTTIRYLLFDQSRVAITIHNILGEEVIQLSNENQKPGYKALKWNGLNSEGKEVASGIYFCVLRINGLVKSTKMTLIR